jgi:phosphatidylserine/phosphatidylglycerophosphate/cardiolipin synthase-like enzyme
MGAAQSAAPVLRGRQADAGRRRRAYPDIPSRRPSRARGFRVPVEADGGGRRVKAWTDPALWGWIFFSSEWAIRLAMLAVVPFRRTPAAAKGWLLLIFFEPWVGLLLNVLIGRAKLPRAMARVIDRKNFLHAKHLSVDDAVALIGTSNLDIRSFALNAEVMLMIYDQGAAAQLAAEQERCFANCRLLTLAAWQRRRFGAKVAQNLARLLSPLL